MEKQCGGNTGGKKVSDDRGKADLGEDIDEVRESK